MVLKDFNILILTIILTIYVESLPHKFPHKLHTSKNCELLEDGQELKPKHVVEISNQ